jgi:tetratricopeptide (TPR) repeat protein
LEDACSDFNRAIQINPNVYQFYEERAKVLLKLGKTKVALEDVNLVLQLNPKSEWAQKAKEFYSL